MKPARPPRPAGYEHAALRDSPRVRSELEGDVHAALAGWALRQALDAHVPTSSSRSMIIERSAARPREEALDELELVDGLVARAWVIGCVLPSRRARLRAWHRGALSPMACREKDARVAERGMPSAPAGAIPKAGACPPFRNDGAPRGSRPDPGTPHGAGRSPSATLELENLSVVGAARAGLARARARHALPRGAAGRRDRHRGARHDRARARAATLGCASRSVP